MTKGSLGTLREITLRAKRQVGTRGAHERYRSHQAFDREKIRNDAIAYMGHVHTAQARSFRLAESLAKLHWIAASRAARGHSPGQHSAIAMR